MSAASKNSEESPARPLLRVVRGEPDDAELAALIAVVAASAGAAAPAAVADSYSTPYQTTLTVAAPGVLANDQDVSVGVTAQLVTSVAHGALTLGANGSVSYTPATGFSGADSFVYRTLSAAGASPAATVSITVVAPTEHLKRQWAEAAHRVGIRLDPTFTNRMGRHARHYHGVAVTYAQVAVRAELCDPSAYRPTPRPRAVPGLR